MSTKMPAILSVILTAIILTLFAALFLFVQIIALNGASERQGTMAINIALVCQGLNILLAAFLAGWFTNLAINRLKWNRIVSVVAVVIAGIVIGGILSFLSVAISIPVAGIR